MRFGSELLKKAEQIFTIIHQAPPTPDELVSSLQEWVESEVASPGVWGHCPSEEKAKENAATLLGSSKDRCP